MEHKYCKYCGYDTHTSSTSRTCPSCKKTSALRTFKKRIDQSNEARASRKLSNTLKRNAHKFK